MEYITYIDYFLYENTFAHFWKKNRQMSKWASYIAHVEIFWKRKKHIIRACRKVSICTFQKMFAFDESCE